LNVNTFFTLLFRSWQLFSGALLLFIVSKFLSSAEQGYFYTFNSVVGLQVVFEMGLAFVIIQHSGHYFSKLNWLPLGLVSGDPVSVLRVHAFLRKALVWYGVVALLTLLILIPVGIYFFSHQSPSSLSVDWKYPWIFLVISSSLNLLNLPLFALIEGGGNVTSVYKIKLLQGIIGNTLSWILIAQGVGLWFAGLPAIISALISQYWLWRYYPKLLNGVRQLNHIDTKDLFSWKAEVWPMQWRIGVSWISGYFIFQLFTPVLFHYSGPIEAGKMGMSISIATILTSIGFVWMQANTPELTKYAADHNWQRFDQIFLKYFIQSSIFVLFGIMSIIGGLYFLEGSIYIDRVLPLHLMSILLVSFAISHVISCLAYYLRLHKREPFMVLSVIGAIIVSVGVVYFASLSGASGIVYFLLITNIFYGFPTSFFLWRKLRKAWHN
jgi:O-antigen/teichoic acid export membrane protein